MLSKHRNMCTFIVYIEAGFCSKKKLQYYFLLFSYLFSVNKSNQFRSPFSNLLSANSLLAESKIGPKNILKLFHSPSIYHISLILFFHLVEFCVLQVQWQTRRSQRIWDWFKCCNRYLGHVRPWALSPVLKAHSQIQAPLGVTSIFKLPGLILYTVYDSPSTARSDSWIQTQEYIRLSLVKWWHLIQISEK